MNRFTGLALAATAALVTTIPAWAMPVEDITLSHVIPAEGELDVELRSLEQITLTLTTGDFETAEGAVATLSCPDGTTLSAPLKQNRFQKERILLEFPDIIHYNGDYTLTIKKWSLGDAVWVENPETGHSNPKIEVKWTVVNGLEAGVEYDIEPTSVTPANNATIDFNSGGAQLRQIKLVFPAGTYVNPAIPVTLSNVENRYSQELLFVGRQGASTVTYTAAVSPAPVMSGNYTLYVSAGAFGDEDFVAGKGGHANKGIGLVYSVTGPQTEDGEMIETVEYVLTPQKTEMRKPADMYEAVLTWDTAPETDGGELKNCLLVDSRNFAVEVSDLALTVNGTEAVISFSADLDRNSAYRLVVAEGIFGDSMWLSSDKTLGSANPQMIAAFTPSDITVGVDSVDADTPAGPVTVYTATGLLLHSDASDADLRALPAGLYIIAGKKVMVK